MKRRKKVPIDGNKMFADIATIVKAQEKVKEQQAAYEAKNSIDTARRQANEMQRRQIEAYLSEFHVNEATTRLGNDKVIDRTIEGSS